MNTAIDRSKPWHVNAITIEAAEDDYERVDFEVVPSWGVFDFNAEHGHQVHALRGTYDSERAAHEAARLLRFTADVPAVITQMRHQAMTIRVANLDGCTIAVHVRPEHLRPREDA